MENLLDYRELFAKRRETLRIRLAEKGFKALLVSSPANRYYLSGFELFDGQCNESSGYLLITAQGRDFLLTDSRFLDEAQRLWPKNGIFIYTGKKFKEISDFVLSLRLGPLGFEPSSLCVETHGRLAEYLSLAPCPNLVEGLRLFKDETEIELLAKSCALNQAVFERIPQMLAPGRSEAEIAWEIEKLCRERGAEGMAFATIVGVGPNAALPHAHPGAAQITEECPVLVDMGLRLGGYCSDQTRTFWVGDNPPEYFTKTLAQVQQAQSLAIDALRPGLAFKDAHAIAAAYFATQGVESRFTHSLGHGVGLETHESPRLSAYSEGELAPGMVVTVEPGLYYPEWGGVRWEHMAVITQDGARIL